MSPPAISSAAAPSDPSSGDTSANSSKDSGQWFGAEIKPHEPALRAFLHRKYPTLPDVDDVLQESYIRAFQNWQRGRLTSVKGFLFTVASNVAIGFFRKRKYIAAIPVSELPALRVMEDHVDVSESACTAEELDLVAKAIAGLPARCREVMVRRVLQGWECADIAAELGMSEATVRTQLARGVKKCTEYMRERGIEPENRR